ncbi:MAG TPA: sulfatase, partial [Myxococcota bacterium]|nr:sulfatase [Myxococcota bacterium]
SPHLDALAAEGTLFENAVSNASWTLPGFVAILSGEHPSARVFRGALLRSGVERLRDAGFRTAAFTEGAYVSAHFGMDRGFDTFWEETAPVVQDPSPDVGVAKTFGKAEAWLRENADQRFFLFVHTYECHVPYQRLRFAEGLDPGPFGGVYDRAQNDLALKGRVPVGDVERRWVRALYDGGVAEADAAVGRLLAVLDELGVADRTLVVVVSDHGEQLGEHRPQDLGLHGQTLWDTVLRVPLIVRDPRREGGQRIATQVRTVDVMPTLLELAGVAGPAPAGAEASAAEEEVLDGRSLVPILGGDERADRPAFAELRDHETGRLVAATLRSDGHKLHLNAPQKRGPHVPVRRRSALELYDLEVDPGERHDRAEADAHERARLHGEILGHVAEVERRGPPWGAASRRQVAPGLRERLEALGYLGDE